MRGEGLVSLVSELRRRNVFKVGAAYAILAWVLMQIADVVLPTFNAPAWVMQVFVFFLLLGFPVAIVLAWAFELTPEGLKLERNRVAEPISKATGKRLNYAIIGLLVMAVAFLLYDRSGAPPSITTVEKSIAVLPFLDLSAERDQQWFSDGLADEILNSLSKLPELLVTARTSSFQFRGQERPIGEIADALDVAHVVEGSVRRDGNRLRVTAQLIRAADGFHLWSETYDRVAEDLFAVQEDVAEKIAAALDVVLDDAKRASMFRTGTRNVEAFEAFQRGRAIYEAVHEQRTDESLFDANRWFEQAFAIDPDYSAAYEYHGDAYSHLLLNGDDNPFAPASRAPDLTKEEALQRLRDDVENAYQTTRDPARKVGVDYTRTVMSNAWHRLPALIKELGELHRSGKVLEDYASWFVFQVPLGDPEAYLAQARDRLRLNPLFAMNWVMTIGALNALDRYPEAIDEAHRARGVAGATPELTQTEALAHALSGDLQSAISILSTGVFPDPGHAKTMQALVNALNGRVDEARALAAEIEVQLSLHDGLLWVYHQLGDADQVARLAREIDAQPLGPQRFLLYLVLHANRVPFSLEDTPNFRTRLAEMGLDESHFQRMPRFEVVGTIP